MEELLNLPDESLLLILRYLHFKDIISTSLVSKRLHRLCTDGFLWRWQCQHYFLTSDLEGGECWKARFVLLYREYGRYKCYRAIRKAWWKIETFLEHHCPTVLQSLNGGVTERDLLAAEEHLGVKIPDGLRMSLRIHDGQDTTVGAPGVMGGHMVSTHVRTHSLLSLSKMESAYQQEGFLKGCTFISTDSGVPTQIMAFTEEGGFSAGTVYSVVIGATGFSKDYFETASSFEHWLCEYAEKLEEQAYHVQQEFILKFYHEPGCVDGNIGITVKPTTVFIPELSSTNPPNYFFAYRIILEMSKDAPYDLSCRLDTRYWHIVDGNGREEEVRGPGVVGEHPVMKPGVTYAWISCTTFETPTGEMSGSFQFRNLRTGNTVDVPCPVFHMKAPFCLTAEKRKAILESRMSACQSHTETKMPESEQLDRDCG